jgi:O-6-methylguanine DNA methyltransferase
MLAIADQPAAPSVVAGSRWARIAARDKSADGQFGFSVATTGVYCRPRTATTRRWSPGSWGSSRRRRLDLPLDVRGTVFQQCVWQTLREIPAGRTVSYTDIARRIGAPSAVRAVAGACHGEQARGRNSLPPCCPP